MGEVRRSYLSVVRAVQEPDDADEPARDASGDAASGVAAAAGVVVVPSVNPVAQAVMYAAVSWLSLVAEVVADAVDITPVGERLYEVVAHGQDGIDRALRVRLEIAPGLVMRVVVEPIRP